MPTWATLLGGARVSAARPGKEPTLTARGPRNTDDTEQSSVLDRLVDDTPASRDRVVDFARAACIVVVVLWHWTLSVTFRTEDGDLAMANLLHVVPGSWVYTWVLQVMPVFFLAGGYVNLLGWQRDQRARAPVGRFVGRRLTRLLRPTIVWALLWAAAELVAAALPGEHRWIWEWFPGYLVPLWFIGVYAALIVTVPVTASWHQRRGALTLGALVTLIGVFSVLGRAGDRSWAVWVTAALVWVLCHQLGYAWRSWDLGHRPLTDRVAVAGAGLVGLVLLTTVGGYPRSMVSTVAGEDSNLFPTNAAIAALVVFQLGLLAVATPVLERVLRRRWAWKPVVAVNAVAMTIFLWHMSAYLLVIWVYESLGATLIDDVTIAWWAERGLWLLAPSAVLAVLIAGFGRFELPRAARRR